MFAVVKKLRNIKQALVAWQRGKPRVDGRIKDLRDKLDNVQLKLLTDPTNEDVLLLERDSKRCLHDCLLLEESMLKQKSRDRSLSLGDSNTRYFYSLFKINTKKSVINNITNSDGNCFTSPKEIETIFVDHFQSILGPTLNHQQGNSTHLMSDELEGLNPEDSLHLCRSVTQVEIEVVIKEAFSNKAPDPDGFNTHFFKIC